MPVSGGVRWGLGAAREIAGSGVQAHEFGQ